MISYQVMRISMISLSQLPAYIIDGLNLTLNEQFLFKKNTKRTMVSIRYEIIRYFTEMNNRGELSLSENEIDILSDQYMGELPLP